MGSATLTPLAIVRNRPSNESVISTPFGTRRIPFATQHVVVEDHADLEIVQRSPSATHDGRRAATGAFTMASVIAGGRCGTSSRICWAAA